MYIDVYTLDAGFAFVLEHLTKFDCMYLPEKNHKNHERLFCETLWSTFGIKQIFTGKINRNWCKKRKKTVRE